MGVVVYTELHVPELDSKVGQSRRGFFFSCTVHVVPHV